MLGRESISTTCGTRSCAWSGTISSVPLFKRASATNARRELGCAATVRLTCSAWASAMSAMMSAVVELACSFASASGWSGLARRRGRIQGPTSLARHTCFAVSGPFFFVACRSGWYESSRVSMLLNCIHVQFFVVGCCSRGCLFREARPLKDTAQNTSLTRILHSTAPSTDTDNTLAYPKWAPVSSKEPWGHLHVTKTRK